jgi:hypothetical protein
VWPSTTRNEFRGEVLEDKETGELRGLYLGRTRGEFSGTDAIGLASHGEAMNWLREAPSLPPLILGEGARLGTVAFLSALAARTDLTVGHLVAPDEIVQSRLEERWARPGVKPSSEAFRKGTRTRGESVAAAASDGGYDVVEIDSSWHGPVTWAEILLETTSLL